MRGEFSVYSWPLGETDRYVEQERFVDAQTAMDTVGRLIKGPAKALTERVIVTDGGDCINFEWTRKDGIVYPKREDLP